MYQKILAKLVALYPGLPKAFLGLIAKQLEAKVTEDTEIEGAITALDEQFPIKPAGEEFQREGDRRVTAAKKTWEEQNPKPADNPPGPDPNKPDPKPDEMPAWAKAMMQKIEGLEQTNSQGTIREQVTKKLKDIPSIAWSGRTLPTKADDIDAFVEQVTTEWNEFKATQITEGLMNEKPPVNGTGASATGGKSDKKIEADIESWAKESDKAKPATAK